MKLAWILIFGVLGILARYGALLIWNRPGFPWATFFVNIVGAFCAGWIAEWPTLTPELRTGLLVGFMGGFTTFSAYSLEASRLFEQGWGWASIYWIGTPVLGLTACYLGRIITKI